MSRTLFTSDTHFYHKNVIKFDSRPFENVLQMNEVLIHNWNKSVDSGDTVYLLGDVSFAGAEKTLEILNKLNGNIHLVLGNHDKNMKAHVRERFVGVYKQLETTVDGVDLFMCHFPYDAWPRKHEGVVHLHGHSHGKSPSSLNRYDVGCMNYAYKPVDLSTILGEKE